MGAAETGGGTAALAVGRCGSDGGGGAVAKLGVDGGNSPVDGAGELTEGFDGVGAVVATRGGAVSGAVGCPTAGAGVVAIVAARAAPSAGPGVTLAAATGALAAGGVAAGAVAGWTTCGGWDVAVGTCVVDDSVGAANAAGSGAEDADCGNSTSARSIAAGWVACGAIDGCVGGGGCAVLTGRETGGAKRG